MRLLFAALGLMLASCGGAMAATQALTSACDKVNINPDSGIAACTAIINAQDRRYGIATAYTNRCSAYNNKGSYDLAIADCDQAIRLDPRVPAPTTIAASPIITKATGTLPLPIAIKPSGSIRNIPMPTVRAV